MKTVFQSILEHHFFLFITTSLKSSFFYYYEKRCVKVWETFEIYFKLRRKYRPDLVSLKKQNPSCSYSDLTIKVWFYE